MESGCSEVRREVAAETETRVRQEVVKKIVRIEALKTLAPLFNCTKYVNDPPAPALINSTNNCTFWGYDFLPGGNGTCINKTEPVEPPPTREEMEEMVKELYVNISGLERRINESKFELNHSTAEFMAQEQRDSD